MYWHVSLLQSRISLGDTPPHLRVLSGVTTKRSPLSDMLNLPAVNVQEKKTGCSRVLTSFDYLTLEEKMKESEADKKEI